ncbi:LPS biosynthesis glycosyltransferase [Leptolyngbya ohadii]|uniref:LPS biosynthesis glycosyltransferase n=1 Tax=Leptolyngbya ohadii TaxID=1962290 RepID=UPI0021F1A8E7|nr:LPS biosynthesis glycosyltransferase [Leptolyngbya ohadii]
MQKFMPDSRTRNSISNIERHLKHKQPQSSLKPPLKPSGEPAAQTMKLPLSQAIGETFIIAYRENTDRLETALTESGFNCTVLRQEDHPTYENCAAIYRCMLNHQRAWKRAAESDRPTLIVEADFVPVVNLGELPLPFNPEQLNVGISWLYTCAPQVYSVTPEGYAEGFSTALVAYILTPEGAAALCGLVDQVTEEQGTGYYNFDSDIDKYLRLRGFRNYIPFRNYGEHGGRSNPEHRRNGMSGIHRADTLAGELAFLPDYAGTQGDRQLQFAWARLNARIKGIGRLITGRFLRWKLLRLSKTPDRLLKFAIGRQLFF